MSTSAEPNDVSAAATDLPAQAYRTGALVSLLRLRWFIRLRWVFVVAALAVLLLERLVNPEAHRPWQLPALVTAVGVVNLVWIAASRILRVHLEADVDVTRTVRSALFFANVQVSIDLLLLTMILRFTGGIENPMMLFYVFHIAIGALLLKTLHAVGQTVWAVGLYAGMALGELSGVLSPHFNFLPLVESPGWYADPQVVSVVVLVHACGVFGVLYFTLQIAARLDRRDRQLLATNEALRKSQTAIQDLQARRSRFMQTAAHQLKAPLAVIQTLAALVRDEVVPPEAVRPTTDKIMRRCRDGIAQVTELLALARVQEADPRRHRQALTDVGQVVTELCKRFQPIAEEKKLSFGWRVPEDRDLQVYVDPRDAGDCIGNLIENAIKFTPGPGSVHVKVASLKAEQLRYSRTDRPADGQGGYVYVTVRDTGIGIDADALSGDRTTGGSSIFDAFRRANTALSAGIPGSGLGLSIVREIVEQVGGRIKVHSRPGHGSTFTVMFPGRRTPPERSEVRDTRSSQIVVNTNDARVGHDSDAAGEAEQTPAARGGAATGAE